MGSLPFRQIHLDFHTSEQICDVGRDFDAEEFARILHEAHVNSITCFARCHHGMIYYDTRLPAKHPYLERNLLREQIAACHRLGIKVPIYITVGWDEYSASRHPEWLERDTGGRPDGAGPLEAGWRKLCLNTEYVDYVAEQTEDVLDLFGSEVDGFFFDIVWQGECCCNRCLADMLKADLDPKSSPDRQWFAKQVVSAFKSKMSSLIRRRKPDCGIFYNAGHVGPSVKPSLGNYTHLDLESLPSGGWGYEHFPVTARYARNLGLEFLGMTGRFLKSWADFGGFKNAAALEYECFSALALGGACSIGDQLHPSGRLTTATYRLIGKVYEEVARKEAWCVDAIPVTEIAVVNPDTITEDGPADGINSVSAGVHRMLKERYYQYDFVDFDMDLSRYKVVILPDLIRLDVEQARVVNNYVGQGGKLVVSYQSGMSGEGREFLIEGMPAKVKGEARYSPDYLSVDESLSSCISDVKHVMYERGLEMEPLPGAKMLAQVWKPFFERNYKHFCSHFHTPVECPSGYPGVVANGSIVYIGYPIFGMYKRHGSRAYRDIVTGGLDLLLPDADRLITTDAPTTAEITLNYQASEDRYVVHLLHYIPERRYDATDTIEDIIPLYNIGLSVLLPDAYTKAVQEPDGIEVACARSDGRLRITVPEIRGHAMIALTRQ